VAIVLRAHVSDSWSLEETTTNDNSQPTSVILSLLEQTLTRLRQEHAEPEESRAFDELKVFSTGSEGWPGYAEVGAGLELSANALKLAVHRLRKRYREILRLEIADTVASPAEVGEELRPLFAALSGP
jgi:RNA polymerase sigma-70 factor (ECF subfamily)